MTSKKVTEQLERGTPIRFTTSNLGVMRDLSDYKFVEGVSAQEGDEGRYEQPHPAVEGWHVVSLETGGETYYVPVDPVHFTTEAPSA